MSRDVPPCAFFIGHEVNRGMALIPLISSWQDFATNITIAK